MGTHITGSGREKRSKGLNAKPLIYLLVEIFILAIVVFLISFAEMKWLTVLSALLAIFLVIMSCIPRYRKVKSRQTSQKVHNSIHKI